MVLSENMVTNLTAFNSKLNVNEYNGRVINKMNLNCSKIFDISLADCSFKDRGIAGWAMGWVDLERTQGSKDIVINDLICSW